MSQDLIPTDNIEPISTTQPHQITFEQLPSLLPQQRLMLAFILNGDNYTDAYRKAGYKSKYAKQAALVLISRNPLKAHLDYFFGEMAKIITPDYIVLKLAAITDIAMDINNAHADLDVAIKAIAELNKMQGNYAQTTTTQINNINGSIDDVRKALGEYKKEC